MPFFLAIARAFVLMVVLPVATFAIANLFLPPRFIPMPMIGELSVRHVLAGIVFVIGFLVWAQRPTGRERDDDFSPDPGDDPE
jgi:hypothetical protein